MSAAALGGRKKPFHVNVSGSTTSCQVVAKVLEKLQNRDPPLRYQLWAASSERGEPANHYHCGAVCTRKARGAVLCSFTFACCTVEQHDMATHAHTHVALSLSFLEVCVGGEWLYIHTPGSVRELVLVWRRLLHWTISSSHSVCARVQTYCQSVEQAHIICERHVYMCRGRLGQRCNYCTTHTVLEGNKVT